MPNDTSTLRTEVRRMFAPPPHLTVTEFANQHRRLSRESSAEPGQYNSARAPYQAGIQDCFNDPKVETIVVQSSAQVGKTTVIENCLAYIICRDPGPTLVVQPSLEMAQAFSKDRLAVMLRDSPIMDGLVAEPRSKDANNTLQHKVFPGGSVTLVGGNSPSGLAARAIRFAFFDEVDRFPASAGPEGDPVTLGKKRTTTFPNRKIMLTSTPTVKGASRIEHAFLSGDQRYFHVPCPECGKYQPLQWKNLHWPEGKPQEAIYHCEACGVGIGEHHKQRMLRAGKWVASALFNGTASFHLSELYSSWVTWSAMAENFLQCKAGGSEMLRAFINTSLGQSWDGDGGEGIEAIGLLARLEQYEPEDLTPLAITAGVDVQRDRLECSLVGWGAGEEAWLLDHVVLAGDTAQAAVWEELADLFREHRLSAAAIDSGFNTSQVYAFCSRFRYCFPIKGASGMNRPFVEDARKRAQRLRRAKRGVVVELLGVDGGKVLIHSRLRLTTPGPGYVHFPDGPSFDDEYFQQLGAERLVTRYKFGQQKVEWQQTRPRNEALDCLTYSLGALRLWGGLNQAAARQERAAAEEDGDEPPVQQRPTIRRITNMNRFRQQRPF